MLNTHPPHYVVKENMDMDPVGRQFVAFLTVQPLAWRKEMILREEEII